MVRDKISFWLSESCKCNDISRNGTNVTGKIMMNTNDNMTNWGNNDEEKSTRKRYHGRSLEKMI